MSYSFTRSIYDEILNAAHGRESIEPHIATPYRPAAVPVASHRRVDRNDSYAAI